MLCPTRTSPCGQGFPDSDGANVATPNGDAVCRHPAHRCSWWGGLVFTNNLFRPECLDAAVNNALGALPALVAAGVDGVFLDGVVDFDIGCSPKTPCTRREPFNFTPSGGRFDFARSPARAPHGAYV